MSREKEESSVRLQLIQLRLNRATTTSRATTRYMKTTEDSDPGAAFASDI
jgi:hypothetical protein